MFQGSSCLLILTTLTKIFVTKVRTYVIGILYNFSRAGKTKPGQGITVTAEKRSQLKNHNPGSGKAN